jgi:cellulose synthase/poly-beta-1,6-N-acetylglucosamine synthase-like glycosyltransferase
VTDALPQVTVIIPARPGQNEVPAVDAARALEYPHGKLEVLVARGRQPAVQRNTALKSATGDIIYFLDDDAKVLPANLQRAVEHFRDPAVAMVGGPNLCPSDAPRLEQIFAVVLSSWLGFMSSRARYDKVGLTRATTEKELILCNLLARRSALLEAGGFDQSLYPNEENALMDHIQKRGGKLLYDPELAVYRRPRPTLKAFVKMLLNYGRGRAEQFRRHPTPGSAANFVPPTFCIYLVTAPWFGGIALAPLGLYALALLAQTSVLMTRRPVAYALAAMPLIVLTHVFYGLGFWRGLFTRLKQSTAASAEVTIERIAL